MNSKQHPFPPQPAHLFPPLLILLWVLAFAAVPVWSRIERPAWDVTIYLNAVHALRAGHDPYADAIAIQKLFHSQLALHPGAEVPYSYVYSPITLPLLAIAGALPLWLSGAVYWSLYLAGLLAQVWVGILATEPRERRWFLYLAPVAAFFPGLLASDISWSGNIAYILYGAVLLAAVLGWRRNQWHWFYIAAVLASCVKAPLLTLLAIPVLSARRQWLPASLATLTGIILFAIQPVLWPSLFHHYLQAVELQFSYNRDFGSSPAGLFSGVLFDHNIPYSPASYIFFLAYALPLFALLVYLSRLFLRGLFTLQQWLPVLLVGVILLNPRILEYDEILLCIPLSIIGWRFFTSIATTRQSLFLLAFVFVAANVIAFQNWKIWKLTEGPLLVLFFAAGTWNLLRQARTPPLAASLEPAPAASLHPAI